MKKENRKKIYISAGLLVAFILWTVAVVVFDVKTIGPQETSVGFATVNNFFHKLTGVNMDLYTVTDWLGLVPLVFALGFALLGLVQWIKRKNILKVDYSILCLGGFYLVVIVVYFLFEKLAINYRPVLINGFLEASYPSSTTMLVMCIMPTAIMQLNVRIKNRLLKIFTDFLIVMFIVFMVVGRMISGVHWLSDIIGGILLSGGLVMLYYSVYDFD